MKRSFGSREFYKCLVSLGFKPLPQKGTSHQKFLPPKKVPQGVRPFLIIQMGVKTYDPHTATRYISQIKKFGFTEEEVLKVIK